MRRRSRLRAGVAVLCWLYLATATALAGWVSVTAVFLRWHAVVVTGASMAPKLQAGDVVMFEPVPDHPLVRGELIRFRMLEGGTVVHRIERVNADGTYQTKGDANPTPDPRSVAPTDVRGVGRLLVPLIGRPWLWRTEGRAAMATLWFAATVAAAWLALRSPRSEALENTDG